eukprot:8545141-Pyramimonas_sp.AAC.1
MPVGKTSSFLSPQMGRPKGTDTATPWTSPGVRSDQDFEANPAVATRASQEAEKREKGRKGRGMGTSSS